MDLMSIGLSLAASCVVALGVLAMVGNEMWRWSVSTRLFITSIGTTVIIVPCWFVSMSTAGWFAQACVSLLLIISVMAMVKFGFGSLSHRVWYKRAVSHLKLKPLSINWASLHLSK
ncbi:MAG: hypothetical protein ACOH18_04675 [Candidatus Saccharimonadaceae bacterium]